MKAEGATLWLTDPEKLSQMDWNNSMSVLNECTIFTKTKKQFDMSTEGGGCG